MLPLHPPVSNDPKVTTAFYLTLNHFKHCSVYFHQQECAWLKNFRLWRCRIFMIGAHAFRFPQPPAELFLIDPMSRVPPVVVRLKDNHTSSLDSPPLWKTRCVAAMLRPTFSSFIAIRQQTVCFTISPVLMFLHALNKFWTIKIQAIFKSHSNILHIFCSYESAWQV